MKLFFIQVVRYREVNLDAISAKDACTATQCPQCMCVCMYPCGDYVERLFCRQSRMSQSHSISHSARVHSDAVFRLCDYLHTHTHTRMRPNAQELHTHTQELHTQESRTRGLHELMRANTHTRITPIGTTHSRVTHIRRPEHGTRTTWTHAPTWIQHSCMSGHSGLQGKRVSFHLLHPSYQSHFSWSSTLK